MAAKLCDINYSFTTLYTHALGNICVKFHLNLFSHFGEEGFWRFIEKQKPIWLPNHLTDDISKKIFVDHFIPRWPSKFFILIRYNVLHMQLWHHSKGTYDIIKKSLISHEEYLLCAKFQFLSLVRFQRYRCPKFFSFSNMAATPRDLWCHNYH